MNMKPIVNRLNSADRAVSPVIGVILMVAITVILAAVIGTFVLDLGQSTGNSAPSASLSIQDANHDYNPSGATADAQDIFVINHQGGDELDGANLQITVRNASSNQIYYRWDESEESGSALDGSVSAAISINGNSLTVENTTSTGDVIEITYPGGGDPGAWEENQEYIIQIVDTESESTVASSTVELR